MDQLGILSEPVLVGRTRELEQLQHYLELASEGNGSTVFVSGEAGTGKTKLVANFLNAAMQKREIAVLSGWCLSGAGIPYFPFLEAFSAHFATQKTANTDGLSIDEAALNPWLKGPIRAGLSGSLETISPEAWKELTFGAVKKALVSISDKRPTVLFLDDIHWADSASLALLHYISRTISTNKVLVIATFRREDLHPDREGRPSALSETLRLMGRENLFLEVKLFGLSQTDVGLLAEHMVGGSVLPSLAEKLQNESQGNPLFVVESLRMLSENNCLVQKKNKWCLSSEHIGVPPKIKDIILHRVSGLTAEYRKILDVASVLGAKFDPELLASVLHEDNLKVLEALDKIAQVSSLIVPEGSKYRFDHAKSRDALYDEMSQALRKAYHDRIAQQLEMTLKDKQVSDLAYHYRGAENLEKAVKYSLAAGEQALQFVLGTEAIKHFNYVLDNTVNDPNYSNERTIALEGLGDGLYANASAKSIKIYEQLPRESSSSIIRVRALRKAAYASLLEGNYGHALDLVNSPLVNPPTDKLENARFRFVKGMVETWGGYVPEAKADLQEAYNVFAEAYSLVDIIETLSELGLTYILERSPDNSTSLGQPEKALASALFAHTLAKHTKNLSKQVMANYLLFIIYNKCGLLKEAIETVEENFHLAEEIGDPVSRASNQAWTYWMSGYLSEIKAVDRILSKLPLDKMQNFGTATKLRFYMSSMISGTINSMKHDLSFAIDQSLQGVQHAEEADFFEVLSFNYENLAREYAELGKLDQAKVYYEKMEKIFNETSLSGFMFANIVHLFTKAIYFQSKRQWDEANRFYEEAITYYKKMSPGTGIMAGIQQGYCWALLQQGRFEDAKEQYQAAARINGELEKRLVHSNILAYVLAPAEIEVGKLFNVRVDIINVAKNTGSLVGATGILPTGFQLDAIQPRANFENGVIDLQSMVINPFQDISFTLTVQATKEGTFNLNPTINYVDDLGETKTCTVDTVRITVLPPKPAFEILPGRLLTGFSDLDKILLGGIPEKYAVALVGASCEERQNLVDNYLKTGAHAGEPTLYIASEPASVHSLAETYQTLCIFAINPPVTGTENPQNILTIKGVENLTDIDIALTKYFRKLDPSIQGPRRACIQILSDVLLQHHATTTRKWLSGLLANLRSKGFTTVATIDPTMHPSEETQAILGLFDGEIRIAEKETPIGLQKTLVIHKLYNQKHLENQVILNREQ